MKKTVLMIGPSIEGNGGIASVIKSYTETKELNEVIDIISSYKDGSKFKKVFEFIKGLSLCFYKLVSNKNIKVVHIHSASRASFKRKRLFFILSKLFQKKVILHIHGAEFMKYFDESTFKQKEIIINTMTSSDIVIALSSKWKENLNQISRRDNISVLYNPVLVDKFKKSNCEDEKLVFMGRVGERKGIYDLIKVITKVVQDYPDIKLYVCGDGELDKVREIIEDNKLENNVYLLGWINGSKKINILNESSINILPSYDEGMPVSILEAMSTGIPTVATNIAGIPEEIEDGKNGYLISPGNKSELYNSIIKLLEDAELRKNMGNECLIKVKEKFDISVIEKKVLELYKNI